MIISGDSDFSPLVSKLRENAKQVIGVGVKQSTSDLLIANCDEFIFYADLVRETRHSSARPEPREAQAPAPRRSPEEEKRRREELDSRRTRAVTMAVETCDALIAERGDTGKIWASMLKDAIKRRQPGFNESYFGFKAFGNLLDEAQARGLLEVSRDEKSGTFVTRAGGQLKAEPVAVELAATEEPSVEAPPVEGRRPSRRNGRGGRKAAPAPELVAEAPTEVVVETAPVAEPEAAAKIEPEAEPAKQERRRKGRRSAKAEETPAADTAAPAAEPVFDVPPAEAPAAAPRKARSGRKKADKKPEAAEAPVVAPEAPADAAPKKPRSRRTKKTEEKTEG